MAIREKQTGYRSQIGVVSRGSGLATAATNAQRQANAFDNLLNTKAQETLERLRQRGERLGQQRAAKTQIQSSTQIVEIDGEQRVVNVPIFPETPSGMGLSEAQAFEKNIINLFNNKMKTEIDSEIQSASMAALDNNLSPDIFDKDVDAKLKPYFEAMPDGSYSEMMRIYAQERKDVHGFKVFSNDRTNKRFNAKENLDYRFDEASNYAYNRYKDGKISKTEFFEILDLESADKSGIDTTIYRDKALRMITGMDLAHDFFKEYPVLGNPANINKLNKLVSGSVESINLDGKTVTRENLLRYLDDPAASKIISEEIKRVDIFNNESYINSVSRERFENDIENLLPQLINGEKVTTAIAGDPETFSKLYKKNKNYYDEKIGRILKREGINDTPQNKYQYLLGLGYSDEFVTREIESVLRQPSEDGINSTIQYMKMLNNHGMENSEFRARGMSLKQKRQLSLFVGLHKRTDGSPSETAELYQSLKDRFDSSGDINQILKTNITTSTRVNNRSELREEIQQYMSEREKVFRYDRDFVQEVQNDVEIQLMMGATVDDDDDYPVMIEQAINHVQGYDKKYSEDYTTSPVVTADEMLTLGTDPFMQSTRIVKYGALGFYGIADSEIDSKLSQEPHIHYMHDTIINELKTADETIFGGKTQKNKFIRELTSLKETKEFFYKDERTAPHIQLMPISKFYPRGQSPDYFIGIWDIEQGAYRAIPTESGTFINIIKEEFDDARQKYINKLEEERYG